MRYNFLSCFIYLCEVFCVCSKSYVRKLELLYNDFHEWRLRLARQILHALFGLLWFWRCVCHVAIWAAEFLGFMWRHKHLWRSIPNRVTVIRESNCLQYVLALCLPGKTRNFISFAHSNTAWALLQLRWPPLGFVAYCKWRVNPRISNKLAKVSCGHADKRVRRKRTKGPKVRTV